MLLNQLCHAILGVLDLRKKKKREKNQPQEILLKSRKAWLKGHNKKITKRKKVCVCSYKIWG